MNRISKTKKSVIGLAIARVREGVSVLNHQSLRIAVGKTKRANRDDELYKFDDNSRNYFTIETNGVVGCRGG